MIRRPFFSFYGSKFRLSRHYPAPQNRKIVEPFAGSAGYSCSYYWLDVQLYDLDPVICAIWDYLIHASSADILGLPIFPVCEIESIDALSICNEAKCLIGFWLGRSSSHVRVNASCWAKKYVDVRPSSFWGNEAKALLAHQIQFIRHWKISESDFSSIPNSHATWFIDPPYSSSAGSKYFGSATIDYAFLSEWSRSRRGQKIVCEHNAADWLPFSLLLPLGHSTAGCRKENVRGAIRAKRSRELIWTNC